MGWIDRQHIPVIRDDPRYQRLISLTLRLLEKESPVPVCGNCSSGSTTIRDEHGNETTVPCGNCNGTGETGTLMDNEDNGQASGGH